MRSKYSTIPDTAADGDTAEYNGRTYTYSLEQAAWFSAGIVEVDSTIHVVDYRDPYAGMGGVRVISFIADILADASPAV